MFTRPRAAIAALLAAGTLLSVGSAQAVDATSPSGVVFALTGNTNNGYVRGPGATRWTNFGGEMKPGPAVVQAGSVTHLIGTASTGQLMHRTATTGWAPLAASTSVCYGPSAVASGNTVTVACIGGTKNGYTASFDATQQNPYISRFTNIGGSNLTSLTVTKASGGAVFMASGGWYTQADSGGARWQANTYIRHVTDSGWSRFGFPCDGPIGFSYSTSRMFAGCQTGNTVSMMVMDTGSAVEFYEVSGRLIGNISFVPTGDGTTAQVTGLDSNGVPRFRPVTLSGPTTTGWASLSGTGRGSLAAAPTADLTLASVGLKAAGNSLRFKLTRVIDAFGVRYGRKG